MGLRRRLLPLLVPVAVATTLLAGTCVLETNASATAALAGTSGSRTLAGSVPAINGEWPGVGKICEPGAGGASSVRGVGPKTIGIAVFNDESNTVLPGLEREFVQFADAFAAWCNASGGINGRHIVIDSRDAALFNSAQVTNEACQSDFMAVGGGMVFDAPTVPVRVSCGLGQITGYTPSDAGSSAALQVNPSNTNPKYVTAGWFAALAKKYPEAVQKAALGAENNPNVLEPEHKYEYAAEAQGWKVEDFQIIPLSVTDWTPYIQDLQSKGIEAVWPSDAGTITSYVQAMATAGYDPAFLILGVQFYAQSTIQAIAGLHLPPVYVETSWWPFELASQNPSTEQLVQVMHTYAKGDTVDFDDEEAAESWLLWAKAASDCGSDLTVSCVLDGAASQPNWSAGGIEAPVTHLTMSDENPVPSPCFALLQATPHGFVYAKSITRPTQSIWNCNPKNVIELTPQQIASLG
ncbi:MAG TPA: ABC transporter substrate-binding protein, partial [Acidimicrobiales bacterium]|nr:ABC transporter substrate-binding protein [Acidimicrobiales bacterium]